MILMPVVSPDRPSFRTRKFNGSPRCSGLLRVPSFYATSTSAATLLALCSTWLASSWTYSLFSIGNYGMADDLHHHLETSVLPFSFTFARQFLSTTFNSHACKAYIRPTTRLALGFISLPQCCLTPLYNLNRLWNHSFYLLNSEHVHKTNYRMIFIRPVVTFVFVYSISCETIMQGE